MIRSKILLVFCAWIAACMLPASGARAVEPTPIPRDAQPDFSSMRFLLGTWDCSVNSSRRPKPFATHVTTTLIDGGYWMRTRTITDPVPWNAIRIVNDDYVTFDGTRNRWIDLGFDDRGAYDVSESRGWNGKAMAWSEVAAPDLHGMSPAGPRVLTKRSNTMTIEWQSFVEPSGRRVAVTTSCRKRAR